MNDFALHPRLENDTIVIGHFPLSLLLLHKDANYPWFILVPQRTQAEIYQLDEADRSQLMKESCLLAEALNSVFEPDKLNLATIGNMVPQLHYHHVVRFKNDPAWPGPVWGAVPAVAYQAVQQQERIAAVVAALRGSGFVAALSSTAG